MNDLHRQCLNRKALNKKFLGVPKTPTFYPTKAFILQMEFSSRSLFLPFA